MSIQIVDQIEAIIRDAIKNSEDGSAIREEWRQIVKTPMPHGIKEALRDGFTIVNSPLFGATIDYPAEQRKIDRREVVRLDDVIEALSMQLQLAADQTLLTWFDLVGQLAKEIFDTILGLLEEPFLIAFDLVLILTSLEAALTKFAAGMMKVAHLGKILKVSDQLKGNMNLAIDSLRAKRLPKRNSGNRRTRKEFVRLNPKKGKI